MEKLKVDLYARVSTDVQAEEGYSLQEQERRLRLFAEAQNWEINQVYLDGGFSGKDLNRPGIQAVIRDAQSGNVQKVVTYKLDRLSRSQKDTLYLIEDVFLTNRVDFISMTESLDTGTPLGKAMIGILAVFAQLEREEIAERMMLGRIASAKAGNWRGGAGVPIGYTYVPKTSTEPGHLEIDDYEATQVREVFRLFLAGKTFNAIYDYMRHHGYTTKYGSFAGGGAALIPAMLSNRAYIGDIKYQGVWYKGNHTPIIDAETFSRAQDKLSLYRATLDDNKRLPFISKRQLTGLLYCAECGSRWCHTFSNYRTRNGEYKRYEFYKCYNRSNNARMKTAGGCTATPWKAAELENLVWEQVEKLRFRVGKNPGKKSANSAPEKAYQARIAEIDKQLERLIQLYSLGSLPFDAIQKKSQSLSEEKERLKQAISAAQRHSGKLTLQEAEELLQNAATIRASTNEQEKRDYLLMLIERIKVSSDAIDIEWKL